jgi:hypothetical protein
MKLQVKLEISPEKLDELVNIAVLHNYKRVEPRKAWTLSEKKDAAHYAITKIIMRGNKS